MNVLRSWLKERGFGLYVKPGVGDEVFMSPRVVFVDSNAPPQVRLVTLLHECGHVAVFLSRKPDPKRRVVGSSQKEWDEGKGRCRARTTKFTLAELQEEFAAWERGQRLGDRLGVRYSRIQFETVRAKALMTYVRGGVRRQKKLLAFSSARK